MEVDWDGNEVWKYEEPYHQHTFERLRNGNTIIATWEAIPDDLAWWHPRKGSYIPTPIVYEGRLYIGNDHGILTCLDAKTGESLYRVRIAENRGETYSASPVAAGGSIYFTSERGAIHVVKAGPEFKHLATNEMGEICMATPAIDRGQLFVRTTSRLYWIGRKE